MNYDDDNITIGRQIQKQSYRRKTKHIVIDNTIAIDVLEDENTIYEVKKSSAMEEAAIMQLKYYLWYLEEYKDVTMKGMLAYPEERKNKVIELSEEDRQELPSIIEDIRTIITQPRPPEENPDNLPDGASYRELFAA
jgi:CRISPR-associated exonuclease Cas4